VYFVLEAWRHGKPICVIGEGVELLRSLGVGGSDAPPPPGVIVGRNDPGTRNQLAQDFIAALARHRHWGRASSEGPPA
jgi:catalase